MRSVNEFLRYIRPLFWPSEETLHYTACLQAKHCPLPWREGFCNWKLRRQERERLIMQTPKRFSVHFFAINARPRWEVPNVMVFEGQTTFFFFSLRELTCAISIKPFGPSLLKNAKLHFSSLYGGSDAKIFPEGYHSIVMSFDLGVANEDMRCCGVERGRE